MTSVLYFLKHLFCPLSLGEVLNSSPFTSHLPLNNRPKWIMIYGEHYSRSYFVHTGWQSDDLPVFGKIVDVLIIMNTPLLFVQLFSTNSINRHILAYEILPTFDSNLIILSQLSNKLAYSSHTYLGNGEL